MGTEAHAAYAASVEDALESLGSDRIRGLSAAQVSEKRARFGRNQLAEAPPVPLWKKLLAQFKEFVIWILIVAAIISGAMGEWADTLAILAIVLMNGIIGFLQEEKAERALAALQKMSAPTARVIRDGARQSLPASELVPGDVVDLEAGDNIPADVRLMDGFSFRVQEAALTGESTSVDKEPDCLLSPATSLGDRRNMAFMGTVAAAGKASGVVVAIGMNTELGHIAGLLQRYEPEPTPLERRLAELGKVLVIVCLIIVGIIFVLELLREDHLFALLREGRVLTLLGDEKMLQVFLTSVSLAVAAVPEGLPAVVTMALALGLQRMVKRNALVRKLPSVETLGSVTVICSDKTGTLTRNEMTVREVLAGGERYNVTGAGYAPHGEFLRIRSTGQRSEEQRGVKGSGGEGENHRDESSASSATLQERIEPRAATDLIQALSIGTRCNNATVSPRGDGSETWSVVGDPTEGALVVAALKAGVESVTRGRRVLSEIPFDSERKAMSVVVRESDAAVVMYTKGAPEVILAKCIAELRGGCVVPLTNPRRTEIIEANVEMAARALRVLALAYRDHVEAGVANYEEKDLVFAGMVGMIDPPREEAKEAVRRCREAGIRPIMITGDHPATALAIARELLIVAGDDRVVTGQELEEMPDAELARQVEHISVYARVSAEHKLRVVRAWKGRGQVVAMTGDGVNDAPAVKAADIGIAMGVSGTDVTKEASDMVLMDDNFASIVNAVEEGRGIFDNIQKFVHYLLSCNTGEVLLMFVAALIGWPIPLMAAQLLWINLVTDGLPALALGLEPPEPDIMRRRPRPPREPVITLERGLLMLVHGTLIALAAIIGFWFVYQGEASNVARARSVAFCITALSQLFYSLSCRSQRYTMPELGLFSNPHLFWAIAVSCLLQLSVVTLPFARPVFDTEPHHAWEWGLIFLLSIAPVTIIEVTKLLRGFSCRRQAS